MYCKERYEDAAGNENNSVGSLEPYTKMNKRISKMSAVVVNTFGYEDLFVGTGYDTYLNDLGKYKELPYMSIKKNGIVYGRQILSLQGKTPAKFKN